MKCAICGRTEDCCAKCHWVADNVTIVGVDGPAGKHTDVVISYKNGERPTRRERLG